MRKLLLLSNSTNHGEGYLDHAMVDLRELLAGVSRILFVPFALADRTAYTAKFRERMEREGFTYFGIGLGQRDACPVDNAQRRLQGPQ